MTYFFVKAENIVNCTTPKALHVFIYLICHKSKLNGLSLDCYTIKGYHKLLKKKLYDNNIVPLLP